MISGIADVLKNRSFRHLFAAQVVALTGTGLLTVALALLAFELAGDDAGVVLGTALAIKMVAYVFISPVVGGYADRLPRRAFLVSMDLVRALIALGLPLVTEVWQVYILAFSLQSASAAFTPTFQATIPDILPDERDYTKALSLSRLAYDLENLLSPTLAAILLAIIGFHWLFAGTVAGFLLSAALILTVQIPSAAANRARGIVARVLRGIRIYLATPRLRGLLALNFTVAAAGAMVIVNTVVIIRGMLGRPDNDVAFALASFGGGSMVAALLLPRVLERVSDRAVMLTAAASLSLILLIFAAIASMDQVAFWSSLLVGWLVLGFAYSACLVPTGRLLRRSANATDRPAVFAAQFSLSHACWLITYPLAGWLGSTVALPFSFLVLGFLSALGVAVAGALWPSSDPEVIEHEHGDLPGSHPHVATRGERKHAHAFVIDDLHPHWPAVHR